MRPITRIWALSAVCLAALCALRGSWPLALVILLLSPVPAWAFARGGSAEADPTSAWLRTIGIASAIVAVLYVAAIAMGGLPQMHEWRHILSGTR